MSAPWAIADRRALLPKYPHRILSSEKNEGNRFTIVSCWLLHCAIQARTAILGQALLPTQGFLGTHRFQPSLTRFALKQMANLPIRPKVSKLLASSKNCIEVFQQEERKISVVFWYGQLSCASAPNRCVPAAWSSERCHPSNPIKANAVDQTRTKCAALCESGTHCARTAYTC